MVLKLQVTNLTKCIAFKSHQLDRILRAGRADVLLYIIHRILLDEGGTVTYDEIAKACGYKNRSGVWKHIQKLQRLGLVVIKNGQIRAIEGHYLNV